MISFLRKDSSIFFLFFVAIVISAGCILQAFPKDSDYYINADEGTYFRQAQKINQEGFSGFQTLANEYVSNPNLQLFPPPERIAHILFASIALRFSDSLYALSVMSLIFFMIQCVVSFLFVRRYWGNIVAAAFGLLICLSPLSMGLARRALSDTGYYLFITLTLIAFIDYLHQRKQKDVVFFILFFSLAALVKESAFFLLPFFAGVLVYEKYLAKKEISNVHLALFILGPGIAVAIAYFLTFGNTIADIFAVTNNINRLQPHEYIVRFNSGPWYQYFVDYFLLSPWVSITFFLFAGYFLLSVDSHDFNFKILFWFFIYFVFVFALLPKNIRYAQPLDLIYRIGAALAIREIYRKVRMTYEYKTVVTTGTLGLLLATDLFAFNNYFGKSNIYDPISFNLLQAENFFSLNPIQPKAATEKIPQTVVPDSAQIYLNQSLEFYQNGRYQECIEAAKKALEIKPDFAVAYNNICSAYNQLQDWDRAIEAGTKALEIDPGYQLARNNLNWAISQKKGK